MPGRQTETVGDRSLTLFRVPSEATAYDARSSSARSYRYLNLGDIEKNSSSRFSMRWATSSRATGPRRVIVKEGKTMEDY